MVRIAICDDEKEAVTLHMVRCCRSAAHIYRQSSSRSTGFGEHTYDRLVSDNFISFHKWAAVIFGIDADYLVSVRHRTADAPFSYMLFIKFVNSHWLSVCKRQYDIS